MSDRDLERGWDGRTVLITGIGGFVGSGLAGALLSRGATVVGIVRDSRGTRLLELLDLRARIDLIRGSITDPGLVARALHEYEIDTVFHLAAQTIVGVANTHPISTFGSNIAGTWHVLEATRGVPRIERVVVASSDKAYGSQPVLPYTEETPLAGSFPYDASKVCTEVLARCYASSFDLPVAIVRCANIYGPGDLNRSRLVPSTIRSALAAEPPVVRSDGTPERDYLFLSDAVDGYLAVAEHLPEVSGEAFNFGTGNPVSVAALVERILLLTGNSGLQPVVLGSATLEIDRQSLASDKAHAWLSWHPRVGLNEGLERTISWYAGHVMHGRAAATAGIRS
jgi:CDP-glucose 4,6-dehydratase